MTHVTEDPRFGALTARLDTGLGEVTVEGDALPRVELYRAEGTETDEHIPVGTRDGSRPTLTVDGEEAVITPDFSGDGKGRGHVRAEWREDAECEALEASLGYAPATAYGTGAQSMWLLAVDAAGDLPPG
ncbi:hypothetical protein ACFWR9_19225 [Streptomyces sp. NPDC058534]|uniref:hypothetical protein n=1 Tax=Streptomyces sp. NPDC058534 TaxID=3346541 RepID=UPI00364C2D71